MKRINSESECVRSTVMSVNSFTTKGLSKPIIKLITKYGWNSCQLVRTFGLVVYALQEESANPIFTPFMEFIYEKYDGRYEVIYNNDANLPYLRKCLHFNSVCEINYVKFHRTIQGNVQELKLSYSSYNEVYNINVHDGKIHSFAIINPTDNTFPNCPIHYFNIAKSSDGNTYYHSAWAGDNINCKWDKILFTDINELFDMSSLLTRVMLKPENVIGSRRLPKPFDSRLLDTESKDPNINKYVSVIQGLLAKDLYVVEILSSNHILQENENGSRDPLVETVIDVLRGFPSFHDLHGSNNSSSHSTTTTGGDGHSV